MNFIESLKKMFTIEEEVLTEEEKTRREKEIIKSGKKIRELESITNELTIILKRLGELYQESQMIGAGDGVVSVKVRWNKLMPKLKKIKRKNKYDIKNVEEIDETLKLAKIHIEYSRNVYHIIINTLKENGSAKAKMIDEGLI
jgi:hypothetical protein